MSHRVSVAALTALLFLLAGSALAQSYPAKPVRIIVPFPPAGPSDIVGRLLADRLYIIFKQPFVIEFKPGANGNLGSDQAAKAAPDGYTLLLATDTVATVNPFVYRSMPFDPFKDLTPISMLAGFTQTLVCNPSVKARNLSELIALARQEQLTYASGGAGASGHLAAEMFPAATGIGMVHVPYKGPVPAITDVVAGQVRCGFLTTPAVLPHVRAGRLNAFAVSSARRSPLAPDVATMQEAGVPGFDATFALVLLAPARTPPAIIEQLSNAVAAILKQPEVRERMLAIDLLPLGTSAADAAATLKSDAAKWEKVARRVGLQLD